MVGLHSRQDCPHRLAHHPDRPVTLDRVPDLFGRRKANPNWRIPHFAWNKNKGQTIRAGTSPTLIYISKRLAFFKSVLFCKQGLTPVLQFVATAVTTPFNHAATCRRFHASTKPVHLCLAALFGLIRSFHSKPPRTLTIHCFFVKVKHAKAN